MNWIWLVAALALTVVVGAGLLACLIVRRPGLAAWTSRHVTCPDTSADAMYRRVARSVFSASMLMPSGRRCAYPALTVRVSPADLERFDVGGDLDGLREVAGQWYRDHALRAGWATPKVTHITIEADPRIRPGWVPAAEGHGAGETVTVMEQETAVEQVTEVLGVDAATEPAPSQWAAVPSQWADVDPVADEQLFLHHDGDLARLPRRSHTILGRHPASPLPLVDDMVSVRHAAIRHDPSGWNIKDLQSKNGTCVNGRPLTPGEWTPLPSGSLITLADEVLSVQVVAESTASPGVRDT